MPPRRTAATASRQPFGLPVASITTSASCASPGVAPNSARERAPLRGAARDDDRRAGVLQARAEQQAHRPGPEHRDRLSRASMPAVACSAHASGSTSAATSEATVRGTGWRLTRAIRSGTTSSSAYAPFSSGSRFSHSVCRPRAHCRARAARRRVRRDDAPARSRRRSRRTRGRTATAARRAAADARAGYVFRSVPSVSASSICTSTSPRPGCGSGTSSTRRSPGP